MGAALEETVGFREALVRKHREKRRTVVLAETDPEKGLGGEDQPASITGTRKRFRGALLLPQPPYYTVKGPS